jgi:hypothetical protein
MGSVGHVKLLTAGSRNSLKGFPESQMMKRRCGSGWDNSQKDLYAAGFEALIKRWDKCISVGGGCVEKWMFFFFRIEYHTFYVLYPFLACLLTLPRSLKLNLAYIPCNQPHSESHIDEDPDLKGEEVVMCGLVRYIAPQATMIDEYAAMINNWQPRKLWKSNLARMLLHRLRISHCYPEPNQGSSLRSQWSTAWSLFLIFFLFCLNSVNVCEHSFTES